MGRKLKNCHEESNKYMERDCGVLYLVATPIGNLKDITLRAIEVLENVDIIACEDTRRTIKLLNHLNIKKKMISYFEHNKREKGEYLISLIKQGENIALVSDAGTPAISDPGEDLVKLAILNAITVVPIPGASAFVSALISSGMPTGRFTFEGFLPVNKRAKKERLESIKNEERTVIFYEAPHKILDTLKAMLAIIGQRNITLARELSKVHEEFKYTTIENAIVHFEEKPPKGEFVIILEGSDKIKEKVIINDNSSCEIDISNRIDFFIENGMERKEAIRQVAKETGRNKKEVYMCYVNKK